MPENTIGVSIGCGGEMNMIYRKPGDREKRIVVVATSTMCHDRSAPIGEYVTWVAKSKLPTGQEVIRVEMLSGGRQHAGQRDRYRVAARCTVPSTSRGPWRVFILKQIEFLFQLLFYHAHPSKPAAPLHHYDITRYYDQRVRGCSAIIAAYHRRHLERPEQRQRLAWSDYGAWAMS